jgi:hypothetical protein
MSIPALASKRRQFAFAGFIFALLPLLPAPALGATGEDAAPSSRPAASPRGRTWPHDAGRARSGQPSTRATSRSCATRRPHVVPLEYEKWGLSPGGGKSVSVGGGSSTCRQSRDSTRFRRQNGNAGVRVAASALPASRINLGPERRSDVIFPAENSFFFNYGLNAAGDDTFSSRQYQFATELAARSGNWLFYNTTSQQWGSGAQNGFTRLLTNLQLNDRPNLRRWTIGISSPRDSTSTDRC